ncbi:MAG: hypothetical protein VX589_08830 [Myxococcota bacterium]|nr:hypothetical protein [Myxococcota bacterium]
MSESATQADALTVDCLTNPPSSIATEAFMEVTCLLKVKCETPDELEIVAGDLFIIHVGMPDTKEVAAEVKSLFASGQHRRNTWDIHVLNDPYLDDIGALKAAFAHALGNADVTENRAAHICLVVHSLDVDALNIVSTGVSRLVEKKVPLDVVAASADIDYRAWARIAHDGRGRLLVPRTRETTEQLLATYLENLTISRIFDGCLTLKVSDKLRYIRVFRAGETPSFLLDREPAEMSQPIQLSLCARGLASGEEQQWLMVAIVPRRRPGEYRIGTVELSARHMNGPIQCHLDIMHTVTAQPSESQLIDGRVGATYARTRPSFWVEELGLALSHEDGSRILNLYDPFIKWARAEGEVDLVETLWTAKRAFQRGGYFGTRQLNEFWRMAHHGLRD